jgi:hypothetical protein
MSTANQPFKKQVISYPGTFADDATSATCGLLLVPSGLKGKLGFPLKTKSADKRSIHLTNKTGQKSRIQEASKS